MTPPTLALLLALAPPEARACGPFFPHSLLSSSQEGLLSGPYGDAGQRWKEVVDAGSAVGSGATTAEAEVLLAEAELGGLPDAVRAAQRRFRQDLDRVRLRGGALPAAPSGLPAAWRAYNAAALAHAAGDHDAALAGFSALAALPPELGGGHGLWAAHMLGRMTGDPRHYADVRERVAAGAADPLGLSAAGLGWEAQEAWAEGDAAGALRRYAQQHAAGDPTAAVSLERRLDAVWNEPRLIDNALPDAISAKIVAAWIVSSGAEAAARRAWLAHPASAAADPETQAWAAWLVRDLGRVRAALSRSAPTPVTHWLRARLAMVDGDVEGALAHLDATGFDEAAEWSCRWWARQDEELGAPTVQPAREVASERGALLLRQQDLPGALAAFAQAGNWLDTAYVADRLATLDELAAAVESGLLDSLEGPQREQLQALYARRLVREGRWAEARRWHPPELAAVLDRVDAGRDAGTAAGLWTAATLVRAHGMELMGTELAPDGAWLGGSFDLDLSRAHADGLLAPTPAEEQRRARSAPDPDARYHYRYVAAELAWQAAEAAPADDPAVPPLLCTAGRWLMAQDPEAADRFYKAMVWRGWGTPLARTADELRWFPPAEQCTVETAPETRSPPSLWETLQGWLG